MATRANAAAVVESEKGGPQKVEKWAAIAGRWKFSKGGAKYLGSDELTEGGRMPIGLSLGPPRFRDGTIKTSVKLERNSDTAGGVVIGYQTLSLRYVTVQLGGWNYAYSIGEFQPEIGWVKRASAGSLSNLVVEHAHELQVRVAGQAIEVTVDDIDVLRHVLSQPIEGSGFGLYTWGAAPVEFTETMVERVEPRIFVIMPFKEPFDSLYREVILPVAEEVGFGVIRVDEIYTPGIILNDIQQQIEQAHAVVAEVSTPNPNVFYELGYAHALRKPAVLLVRKLKEGESLPFDIQGYRAFFYDDSIGGKKTVETNLRQHFSAILRGF